VHPGVTPRAIDTSAAQGPGRVQYGGTAPVPVLVPGGVPGGDYQAQNAAAATKASIGGGLHTVPVDTSYSDRVTQLTTSGGTAGLIIGAAVTGIPAAVIGAVPGAIIGGAIGAIAVGVMGGVALAVPTLGVGAPLGAAGGALAGAGVGAVVGAVVGGALTAIPVGLVGAAAGYALGAATGLGIGLQR
jgi:hypothetical protein